MDCPVFLSIVSGEREDDLTPEESIAFETHLDSCSSCREAVARAEEDLERLSVLADPPPLAAAAWSRVDDAVRAEARTRPGREDPFQVEAPKVLAPIQKLAPTMPAMPARRGSFGLAAAAGLALVIGVFALSAKPPEPTHSRTDIGRVNPPQADDVKVVREPLYGPHYHGTLKIDTDGKFIMNIDECR